MNSKQISPAPQNMTSPRHDGATMPPPDSDGADHDLHEETRRKEENDMVTRVLRPYAAFLVKYPSAVVSAVVLVVVLCAVLGFVSSTGAKDLPDFSKPTKGFAARGTTISLRRTTYLNLFAAAGYPTSSRKRRSLDFKNDFRKEVVLIYEHQSEGDLTSHMKSICKLHKQIILDSTNAQDTLDSTTHHIPNYIAYLNNRSSCLDITNDDINSFFALLRNCRDYFTNNMLEKCRKESSLCTSINATCRSHSVIPDAQEMAGLLYKTFFYFTDSDFIANPKVLKLTSSINQLQPSSVDVDSDYFEPLYEKYLKDLSNAELDSVKVVAYHLNDFKFYIFQSEIIVQSLFIVTAIVIVILFIWFYSGSIFVGLMTFVCVIIATVISYFVYGRVFDMEFFPFLNMVTTIFLVGIGADDAFVYMGIWEEAKKIYVFKRDSDHTEYLIKWTIHSLRHALLAMFVTSLTTAAAFYANISSNVTSVKCFGLFSGTAIIVNYLLMVVFFPVVVVLHDKYLARCMHSCCPQHCKTRPILNADDNHNTQFFQANGDLELQTVPPVDVKPNNFAKKIQYTVDVISNGIFNVYIPTAIMRGRFVWIAFLVGFGIAGIVVTFITPGLRPPSTGDFQMFSSSNSLEQYDLTYKKKFRFGLSSSGGNREAIFAFGVKEVDNGYRFDPDDLGSLEYHNSVLALADEQVWMRDFCDSIRNATFYVASKSCDELNNNYLSLSLPCQLGQTTCCNHTYPVPKDEFNNCLNQNRPKTGVFDGAGNLKAFYIEMETSHKYTESFDENEKLFDDMDAWFQKHAKNIKSSAFQGFWYIEQGFYDLQNSLSAGTKESLAISIAVALCVILITTGNIILSIYSILTIAFIISVTVGILVLAGWRLNIMESVVFSVAAGLSADFTLHYSVAYKTSLIKNDRKKRVKATILEIGPAILMGAFTTFIAGVAMVPASVLVYIQMAQFLMLVMFVSWFFGTFFFLSLCAVIGPVGSFGQIRCPSKKDKQEPDIIDNVNSESPEKVEKPDSGTSPKVNNLPEGKKTNYDDTPM